MQKITSEHEINRAGTIISRSAFSIITKGANVDYYIFCS